MTKGRLALMLAVLFGVTTLICGCGNTGEVIIPTAAPTATQTNATPTPELAEPIGRYETDAEGDVINVYLSVEQGSWQVEEHNEDIITVTPESDAPEGFVKFSLFPVGEIGYANITFICVSGGARVSDCEISLFVNEAMYIEVMESDIALSEVTDDTTPKTPCAYKMDYHRSSQLLIDAVGEDVVEDAKKVIDAFLDYKTSVEVGENGDIRYTNDLCYAVNIMCPPFYALTDYSTLNGYNDGKMSWNFAQSEDDTAVALTAFENEVNTIMMNIDENDCETARAMVLYNALTLNSTYDYDYMEQKEHTEDESRAVASGYAAIMSKKSICTGFAEALCFLYNQMGIFSVTVNGESEDELHAWTLAEIDGELYYCDPTYDLGGGFLYFGMTKEDRCSWAGGFIADTLNTCGYDVDELYEINSDRFSELHCLQQGNAGFCIHHSTQIAEFGGMFTFDCK